MATEDKGILTVAEWYILFTWAFVLSTVLYLVVAAKFESYSGWLWYSLAQTLLVSISVAVVNLFPQHIRTLSESSPVAFYFRAILYGTEALQSIALGILVERYREHSVAFDYFFLMLIIIKIIVYTTAGLVSKRGGSTTTSLAFF